GSDDRCERAGNGRPRTRSHDQAFGVEMKSGAQTQSGTQIILEAQLISKGRRIARCVLLTACLASPLAACVSDGVAPVASYAQLKQNFADEPHEVLIVDRAK